MMKLYVAWPGTITFLLLLLWSAAEIILGVSTTRAQTAIDPSTSVHQSETTIAVLPANPDVLLVGVRHHDVSDGDDGPIGVSWTADGGTTWNSTTLPAGGVAADPVTAIRRPDGMFLLAYLSFPELEIHMSRSTDQGASWVDALVASTPGNADKPHMAVDNNPGSIYYGRIYVAWRQRINPMVILFSYSNNATSWSPAVALSDPSRSSNGANIQIGSDGKVYVIWATMDGESSPDFRMRTSNTGGSSFDAERLVVDGINTSGTTRVPNIEPQVRLNSMPAMAIDTSSGPRHGNIYLAWCEETPAGKLDILATAIEPGTVGKAPPGIKVNQDGTNRSQWLPWLSCDPTSGDLAVVFFDRRDDPANQDARSYLAISHDGGVSWIDRPIGPTFTPLEFNSEVQHLRL